MQAELKKLAALLRERVKVMESNKTVKCAQVAQAAVALGILRRKIGR